MQVGPLFLQVAKARHQFKSRVSGLPKALMHAFRTCPLKGQHLWTSTQGLRGRCLPINCQLPALPEPFSRPLLPHQPKLSCPQPTAATARRASCLRLLCSMTDTATATDTSGASGQKLASQQPGVVGTDGASTSEVQPAHPSSVAHLTVNNIRCLSEAHPAIQPGRVIRCAKPSDASHSDVAHLLDVVGIRDLLDLRAAEEVREDPPGSPLFVRVTGGMISHSRSWVTGYITLPRLGGPPPQGPVMHHQISLLERSRYYGMLVLHLPWRATVKAAALSLVGRKEDSRQVLLKEVNSGGLGMFYRVLVDSARPELLAALTLVTASLEQRRAVLVYCKAGKDRTGIVSMLLLWCAGASREEILDDYVRSDQFHMIALAGLENSEELRGLNKAVFERAPRGAMEELLEYLDRQHGGVGAYLSNLGFGQQQQEKLRALLTGSGRDN